MRPKVTVNADKTINIEGLHPVYVPVLHCVAKALADLYLDEDAKEFVAALEEGLRG